MYVGNRILYLELQKTGSTHIRQVLYRLLGGVIVGQHNRALRYPVPFTVAGSIRNPYSWYVSLWAYGAANHSGQAYIHLTQIRSWKDRLLPRRAFNRQRWKRAYADAQDPRCFREWLRLIHDPAIAGEVDIDYGKAHVIHCAGLLTYRYLYLHTDPAQEKAVFGSRSPAEIREMDARHNIVQHMIRMEDMAEGLVELVRKAGHEPTAELEQGLRESCAKPTNKSRHLTTAEYYDEASRALVAQREAFLLEKYGYTFPS